MSSSPKPTANPADTLLRKVRKEAANMSCPNCGTQAQAGIGFGNVCVKFKTFVCDSCKTSHQAISHRVKSVTMSNWTMDEVNELLDAYGGGNRAASHVWLQNAPPFGGRYPGGSRPKAGDRIEVFKQFVMDCYEYGKFKANTPYQPSGDSGAPSPAVSPKPVATPVPQQQSRATNFSVAAPSPAPVAPAHTTNLLEVDDFFSSSTSSSKPSSSSNNFADFANFSSNGSVQTATTSTTFSASASSSTTDFDPFGTATSVSTISTSYTFQQTSKSTESSANFDLFNNIASVPQQSTPAASQPAAFDPFGSATLTPTVASAPMQQNNNVFNFAQQPSPQQQQGANINNIMNMYGTSNTMGRPMPMGAGAMPQQGYRPNASSAISQMDVFGNNNHMQPRPMGGMGMGGMNNMGGMTPMGGMNSMGARNGMGPMGGMGAQYNAMQGGMYGAQSRMAPPQQAQQSNNSFDFLQDTMKKHLENPSTSYSQNQNNGMRSAPTNPFR